MKRSLVVALSVALLAACGQGEPSDRPSGGVSGTVTAGPTCPVETAASPCSPQPWTGTVRATASDGTIYEAQSDGTGRYQLTLPAGPYTVVAVTDEGGPPTGIPVEVTVGETIEPLDLEVDTGIR